MFNSVFHIRPFGDITIQKLFMTLIMAVIGWLAPLFILNRKISKRLKTINSQLGDTLAVLSNSLKAGHSFFRLLTQSAASLQVLWPMSLQSFKKKSALV